MQRVASLLYAAVRRLPPSLGTEDLLVAAFHRLYYDAAPGTWQNTSWLGIPVLKLPFDLWLYQELLHRVRPDLVIETGTYQGGSAYFIASILDLLGAGRVVTIDIDERPGRPTHPRILYLTGSSTSEAVLARVRSEARAAERVLVILDSDHRRDHVLAEMRAYGPLVTEGSYLIVEDTDINGHPVRPDFGPGPMEAVEAYLNETDAFRVDPGMEKFLLTFNPRGYLLKTPRQPSDAGSGT